MPLSIVYVAQVCMWLQLVSTLLIMHKDIAVPHPGCGAKLAASAVTLLARAPLRVATAALQLLDAVYTGLATLQLQLSLPVSLCHVCYRTRT